FSTWEKAVRLVLCAPLILYFPGRKGFGQPRYGQRSGKNPQRNDSQKDTAGHHRGRAPASAHAVAPMI
ncbi:hypothetical protein AB9F41_37165, partial [Rhizobium leguminosarum]|uniref:hypothetical protein n=1 Tax=Rhizobium leguminosarum TaxID=384 RepID=UPI003F973A8D